MSHTVSMDHQYDMIYIWLCAPIWHVDALTWVSYSTSNQERERLAIDNPKKEKVVHSV